MPPRSPPWRRCSSSLPFIHSVIEADDGLGRLAELGRVCTMDAAQVSCCLDGGHLHAEADAEIKDNQFARELGGEDLALGAALAKTTPAPGCRSRLRGKGQNPRARRSRPQSIRA